MQYTDAVSTEAWNSDTASTQKWCQRYCRHHSCTAAFPRRAGTRFMSRRRTGPRQRRVSDTEKLPPRSRGQWPQRHSERQGRHSTDTTALHGHPRHTEARECNSNQDSASQRHHSGATAKQRTSSASKAPGRDRGTTSASERRHNTPVE